MRQILFVFFRVVSCHYFILLSFDEVNFKDWIGVQLNDSRRASIPDPSIGYCRSRNPSITTMEYFRSKAPSPPLRTGRVSGFSSDDFRNFLVSLSFVYTCVIIYHIISFIFLTLAYSLVMINLLWKKVKINKSV